MKLDTVNINTTSTIQAEADFGMNKEDMPHITNLLRKQIYSDKLLAILREYSTNAYDAHADKGITQVPIEITLPTLTDQNLKIRDFGDGLTEQEIMSIYIKYGASTKRNSNAVTGCLGIGCKSAFAYSTQFKITSYKNHQCNTFLARIDENNVGTISKVSSTSTDQSNGVEISIPINANDHSELINKAKKLFLLWKIKPKINTKIEEVNYHKKTDDWAIVNKSKTATELFQHSATVFMGNIPYPVNISTLAVNDESVKSVLSCRSLVIFAPLGSLDISASREALEYTSKTKNALIAIAKNCLADLSLNINKAVNAETTAIKASHVASKLKNELNYEMSRIVSHGLNWRGKKLDYQIKFPTNTPYHFRKHRWRADDHVNSKDETTYAPITENSFFCVYSDNLQQVTRRIRSVQAKNGWNNDHKYYAIPTHLMSSCTPPLMGNDVIDLDNIEPMKPNRTAVSADGSSKKSVKISVCEVKGNSMKSGRISDNVEPLANEEGKFIYVPLDRYDWIEAGTDVEDPLSRISTIKKAIRILNKIIKNQMSCPIIHGVKKHYLNKIKNNKNWVTLDVYLKNLFKQAEKKTPDLFKTSDLCMSDPSYLIPQSRSLLKAYEQSNSKVLRQIAYAYNHNSSNYHEGLETIVNKDWTERMLENVNYVTEIFKWLGYKKESKALETVENKLLKKYPLIQYLTSSYHNSDQLTQALNKYIKS
jgi:hypothetical protein